MVCAVLGASILTGACGGGSGGPEDELACVRTIVEEHERAASDAAEQMEKGRGSTAGQGTSAGGSRGGPAEDGEAPVSRWWRLRLRTVTDGPIHDSAESGTS